MRLRSQIQQVISERIKAFDPELAQTVWDAQGIIVAFEDMKTGRVSGFVGDWKRQCSFSGPVLVEIIKDGVDAVEFEPLIAGFLRELPRVDLPLEDMVAGDVYAAGRLTLNQMRDTVKDQFVATSLRMKFEGVLWEYAPFDASSLPADLPAKTGDA